MNISITTSESIASPYPALSWNGHQFAVSRIDHDVTIFQTETANPMAQFRIAEHGYDDGGVMRGRYTDSWVNLADLDGAVGDWHLVDDPRLEPPGWFAPAVDAMIADALDLRAALVDEIRAESREDRRRDWADDHRHYTATVLGGRVL